MCKQNIYPESWVIEYRKKRADLRFTTKINNNMQTYTGILYIDIYYIFLILYNNINISRW